MKKNRFSKLIVSFVIIINIFFTIGTLYIFLKTGSEPVALIGAWFTFTTVEIWQLAKIKQTKETKKKASPDCEEFRGGGSQSRRGQNEYNN